ncbi:hypothetical protein QBC43DRAFT_273835 [Cladorrhinum sp. PSN259]|nr:hypothetical protein QBC43DRAFT_273835 [Cladorrhinum sp. PSN259]
MEPPSPHGPPGPDECRISRMLGPLIPIHVLCTLLVGMRVYTRARPVMQLSRDDAAVTLALIATTVQLGISLSAARYGFGRHNFYISAEDQVKASKLIFLGQFPSFWAVALGKIAIAFLLMRLKTGRAWHIFLYSMCAVQVGTATVATVMPLVRCRPVSVAWQYKTDVQDCWPIHYITIAIYVRSAIGIISDVIFALIPLTFLGNIRRSLRERMLVAFLLGLGVFTAAIVGVKLTFASRYGRAKDSLWDSVTLVTWSILEDEMGIIAGTLPCLKSPFEKMLRRVGLLGSSGEHSENSTRSYALNALDPRRKLFHRRQPLDSSSQQTLV